MIFFWYHKLYICIF